VNGLASAFASGRIVDLALGLAAIEAIGVIWFTRRTGRGPAPWPYLVNLFSGGCLMLGLRAALVGEWWGWVALALIGALAAHLGDLRWRWR
jgi:hypothetical protein